jgi:hypothetical protein
LAKIVRFGKSVLPLEALSHLCAALRRDFMRSAYPAAHYQTALLEFCSETYVQKEKTGAADIFNFITAEAKKQGW